MAQENLSNLYGDAWLKNDYLQIQQLRIQKIPFLSQLEYDHLLWLADFNIVRGEDSFVRAIWAEKPFIWNIYQQNENAHLQKLEAFYQCFLKEDITLQKYFDVWNHHTASESDHAVTWQNYFDDQAIWQRTVSEWAQQLQQQSSLTEQVLQFIAKIR